MRRQSYSHSLSSSSGEPQIIVEESTLGEEEAERRRNESPPRCLDPDSPSLNPYLLSPWRETRKHSLPTPQCTSGITASQVRRLSERGGEGSGPSPREAAFLATLSQAPTPQRGGRRHSVVTISRVPPTLFGRNRRESIAALPMGSTRILPRRDSTSNVGPPSNSGSTHNLQLDIMDDIAEIKARKVRLKMWKTPSHERVCEVQPLDGNNVWTQRYIQQQRRYSDFAAISPTSSTNSSIRRRASEVFRPTTTTTQPGPTSPGIVCSNTDLISILSSLTSSATEINRCGEEATSCSRDDTKIVKGIEQKRRQLKDFRSNSFDISILHGTGNKLSCSSSSSSGGGGLTKNSTNNTSATPSSWFVNRHQPMWKKQNRGDMNFLSFSTKFDKSKVVKAVRESLTKSISPPKDTTRHKVVWDDTSGTKVDAQVLGSAIEEFLTSQRTSELEASGSMMTTMTTTTTSTTSTTTTATVVGKHKSGKVTSWFAGTTKDDAEQTETCEQSICSSLKDLFVK